MKEFREEQRRRYEQADERARKLSQQALSAPLDDYEDEDAYRYGQARTTPREPRDVDQTAASRSDRERDSGRVQQREQPRDSHGTDDHEEEDVSKIPRGDQKPQTGKEEKEDLMKKNKEAGKKSNKVEYKGSVRAWANLHDLR